MWASRCSDASVGLQVRFWASLFSVPFYPLWGSAVFLWRSLCFFTSIELLFKVWWMCVCEKVNPFSLLFIYSSKKDLGRVFVPSVMRKPKLMLSFSCHCFYCIYIRVRERARWLVAQASTASISFDLTATCHWPKRSLLPGKKTGKKILWISWGGF